MARPKRTTVDYYPHYVKCGRTIYILESRFGNDGYAFWFKVLEVLGESEGHFYDCSISSNWEYLLAKTRVNAQTATEIIGVLINLGKIDAELWENNRVIWIENFVNNLTEVYRIRRTELPTKPVFKKNKQQPEGFFSEKTPIDNGFSPRKHDKEKESKVKESKVKESKVKEKREYPLSDIFRLWNETCGGKLPKVKALNDSRRQKIKCRLSESGAKTTDEMTAWAKELFERIAASAFLCGENNHQWTATFDWIFENDKNWVKVSEGNYDNKRGSNTGFTGVQNKLGVGEYITQDGRRTYGSGRANIPLSAPPRPSEKYQWSAESQNWIML